MMIILTDHVNKERNMKEQLFFLGMILGMIIPGISSSLAISNPNPDCNSICNFTIFCENVCNGNFQENVSHKCSNICQAATLACQNKCNSAGQ